MDDEVVKAKEHKKLNALFVLACTRGYLEDVKQLLEKGADPTAVDKRQVSALQYACGQGRLEVARFLWTKGVELDGEDPGGNAPLHYAALGQHAAVVAFLLEKGTWSEGSNAHEDTALHIAARTGQEETVKLLLEHGAKAVLNDRNKRGLNACGEALAGGHTRVADILVKAGADIEDRPRGWSLLHLTAGLGQAASVKYLLGMGADVNDAQNAEGFTPLHCAALSGSMATAKALLDKRADLSLASTDGRQAQEVADPSNASLRALLHTKSPPKTPLVPLKAAVGPPTNDLDGFKALSPAAQTAKVDRWAALEDPKQLDSALLEFPAEAKKQVLELGRVRQVLNIQQAIVELLDDSEFQKAAQDPKMRGIIDEVHGSPQAFKRYAEKPAVMDVLRKLQRFQMVVRGNGGHTVPFQSLLRSAEAGYVEKSKMRLEGMKIMIAKHTQAAIAAAQAGSEVEAKQAAQREMAMTPQPAEKAPVESSPSRGEPGSDNGPSARSASTATSSRLGSGIRHRGARASSQASVPEITPAEQDSEDVDRRNRRIGAQQGQPAAWKALWQELQRGLRNLLLMTTLFLLALWMGGNRMPWQDAPSETAMNQEATIVKESTVP